MEEIFRNKAERYSDSTWETGNGKAYPNVQLRKATFRMIC